MTLAPIALATPSLGLSDDEARALDALSQKLSAHAGRNATKLEYYEGRQRVEQLGIAVPPRLQTLPVAAGWAGTVVDVLEERLDWYGWSADGAADFGLSEVYGANQLDVDSSLAHLDALVYGTSFVVVGSGAAGEPSPLVTVHSPKDMTGIWDARRRRLVAAASFVEKDGAQVEATLYLPDSTIWLSRSSGTGPWAVQDRDDHRLGRVPVVQVYNRPSASSPGGRSEISPAVRYYTDAAVRTLLGMEVNREFYSAPQRWVVGADKGDFTKADGSVVSGWEAVMGRVLALSADDDGNLPQVGQFQSSSPAPYVEQVRSLAQLLAAEAAIPASYLGFQTDNPASADAIQKSEARLVKRAERRQSAFGRSWLEVGRLALLVRDGAVPDGFDTAVSSKWRDASTPTRSAAADETTKYVGAGILPADSPVTWDRMGLDPAEQRRLAADRRRAAGAQVIRAIGERAAGGAVAE